MRRWLLAGAAMGGLGAAAAAYCFMAMLAPGPLREARDVVVPRGGVAQIGSALAEAGVVRSGLAFRVLAEATVWQGALKAAELRFPERASLLDVLWVLRSGRPVQHRLTIPEGWTAAQIGELLARENALEGDVALPAEGSVLPESYAFERGTLRETLMARARDAMHRALASAWATRTGDARMLTLHQALVLASVIERETALAQERPRVSEVFLNRLKKGMRLQSDPTVIYGMGGGAGRLGRSLDRDDLSREGPYNTYVIMGLPEGPICSPGLASIEAALHPVSGADLYFVANGTGGHGFAASLGEHERNVAHYRALPR